MTTRADASFIEEESPRLLVLQVTREIRLNRPSEKKETSEEEKKGKEKCQEKETGVRRVTLFLSEWPSIGGKTNRANRTGSEPKRRRRSRRL